MHHSNLVEHRLHHAAAEDGIIAAAFEIADDEQLIQELAAEYADESLISKPPAHPRPPRPSGTTFGAIVSTLPPKPPPKLPAKPRLEPIASPASPSAADIGGAIGALVGDVSDRMSRAMGMNSRLITTTTPASVAEEATGSTDDEWRLVPSPPKAEMATLSTGKDLTA